MVAFEPPVDASAFEKYNNDIVAMAEGMLPPLAKLKLVAVGGNHTNAFLRACKAACATPIVSLRDGATGKLNPAALAASNSKAFEKAMKDGLTWLVVDRRCCSQLYVYAFHTH